MKSQHIYLFTCTIVVFSTIAGILMHYVSNDFAIVFVICGIAQAAIMRFPPKIRGGGPFLIGVPLWLCVWSTIIIAMVIIAAYFNTPKFLLLGMTIAAGALWAFQAFVWVQFYGHDACTDEAGAVAWLLRRRPSPPAFFETATMIAMEEDEAANHKKFILSQALFPCIPPLVLPPMSQEDKSVYMDKICDLIFYVRFIQAASTYKPRARSFWHNAAPITVPKGHSNLRADLDKLVTTLHNKTPEAGSGWRNASESAALHSALLELRQNAEAALINLEACCPGYVVKEGEMPEVDKDSEKGAFDFHSRRDQATKIWFSRVKPNLESNSLLSDQT